MPKPAVKLLEMQGKRRKRKSDGKQFPVKTTYNYQKPGNCRNKSNNIDSQKKNEYCVPGITIGNLDCSIFHTSFQHLKPLDISIELYPFVYFIYHVFFLQVISSLYTKPKGLGNCLTLASGFAGVSQFLMPHLKFLIAMFP